jgi:hypothetical protein
MKRVLDIGSMGGRQFHVQPPPRCYQGAGNRVSIGIPNWIRTQSGHFS